MKKEHLAEHIKASFVARIWLEHGEKNVDSWPRSIHSLILWSMNCAIIIGEADTQKCKEVAT
jgi:hypothetical protein